MFKIAAVVIVAGMPHFFHSNASFDSQAACEAVRTAGPEVVASEASIGAELARQKVPVEAMQTKCVPAGDPA